MLIASSTGVAVTPETADCRAADRSGVNLQASHKIGMLGVSLFEESDGLIFPPYSNIGENRCLRPVTQFGRELFESRGSMLGFCRSSPLPVKIRLVRPYSRQI